MRLIDADKLIHAIHDDWDDVLVWDESGTVTADEFERLVYEQPTVDAIPKEWLHHIMEKQLIFALSSEMEGTTTVKDGVIHCVSGALACQVLANVIEAWEKEKDVYGKVDS